MKILTLIAILLTLTGCKNNSDNLGIEELFDPDSGIILHFSSEHRTTLDRVVSAWIYSQECSGLTTGRPPLVVTLDDIEGNKAFYILYDFGVIFIETEAIELGETLKHSMLHYILSENGLHDSSNLHPSRIFKECTSRKLYIY